MRVSQVDITQKVIRLEPGTTKNGEGREVVMTNAISVLCRPVFPARLLAISSSLVPMGNASGTFVRHGRTLVKVPEFLDCSLRPA